MRALIRWAIDNSPAMNTLMIGALVVGILSVFTLRREVFPEFELEIILVTVPYPGASPSEVEQGVCQKVEEAVRSIDGIKMQTAVAKEGSGFLVLELSTDVDPRKVLSEVRSEIDRIPSFPELTEDPEIKQLTLRSPAINLAVLAPESSSQRRWTAEDELALRELTEEVREDLLHLSAVSQATIVAAKPYQIDIEISEDTLRKHNLTLQQVAEIVRRENLELPGGDMKTDSQTVLLRGKNKRLLGEEIAEIPLVTRPDGSVLKVTDLGVVRDEFDDTTAISEVDGRPALVISVERTSREDLLRITEAVHKYAATADLPGDYELLAWGDRSIDVRDRMELLAKNGLQGLVLVFLVLAIFLELRLAFWVAIGVPVSVLGACAVLLFAGQTLNMLSMFAFLMAMGILVDDAIVIGENIYTHRQLGKPFHRAAIDGAQEVLPSVIASVTTTIIAFIPLMFVAGVMGKFIAVMPLAMIAMLVISLLESTFILPVHLAHRDNLALTALRHALYPLHFMASVFAWINEKASAGLDWFVGRYYVPSLRSALARPLLVVSVALATLMISFGFVRAGIIPWVVFPKIDTKDIYAQINYPEGTPEALADAATKRIHDALWRVNDKYGSEERPLVRVTQRMVGEVTSPGALGPNTRVAGSHVGVVNVELTDVGERDVHSNQILDYWREEAGKFPGAERLIFDVPQMGPGGVPIEFKILAPADKVEELEELVELCKARLRQSKGVYDVADDSLPGKWEYQIQIKDQALAMGVPLAEVAQTVRASYYGEEVMRLQRGRHEVKLMVRYPREERRSLASFDEIRVRAGDGAERPITELARVEVERGVAEINRVDQMRSITITANIREGQGNAAEVTKALDETFLTPLLKEKKYEGVRVLWEGQAARTKESLDSMAIGFLIAMLAMYVLLTVEFRSYAQPLLILSIIPFGTIGAIWGHWLLGLPLTMFSMFGLVALTGVVVNDSIVLVDFINARVKSGMPIVEALLEAGSRRFRPVLLTSVTTIAGLLPILVEKSLQAQILIPMAASLVFGLALTTVLVLILAPTLYVLYDRYLRRAFDFATEESSQPPPELAKTGAEGQPG